jgi:hypothetical protein
LAGLTERELRRELVERGLSNTVKRPRPGQPPESNISQNGGGYSGTVVEESSWGFRLRRVFRNETIFQQADHVLYDADLDAVVRVMVSVEEGELDDEALETARLIAESLAPVSA